MSVLASFHGHSMQARVSLDEGTSVEEMPLHCQMLVTNLWLIFLVHD